MTVEGKESDTKFPSFEITDKRTGKIALETPDQICLSWFNKSIQEWFKQCVEDIPVIPLILDYEREFWRLNSWIEKWFEQFMEEES